MMTGQVLAGQDPQQAARYQIMILYLIAAGSLASITIAIALAANTSVNFVISLAPTLAHFSALYHHPPHAVWHALFT